MWAYDPSGIKTLPLLVMSEQAIKKRLQHDKKISWSQPLKDVDVASLNQHDVYATRIEGTRGVNQNSAGETHSFDDLVLVVTKLFVSVPITSQMVNSERDRRADLGFTFGAHLYQSKAGDRTNIIGAISNAQSAILSGGGLANDYRWHGGSADFSWIASDNAEVVMDAPTLLAFGGAAATHKEKTILSARALKNMVDGEGAPLIPTDYATNESYWA